jgi:hypothetical protein
MAWRSRSKTADRQAGRQAGCTHAMSIHLDISNLLPFYLSIQGFSRHLKKIPQSAILHPFTHSHLRRQTTLEFPKQCQKGKRTTNGWRENPNLSLEELKGASSAKLQSGCIAGLHLKQARRASVASIATYLRLSHHLYHLTGFRAVD